MTIAMTIAKKIAKNNSTVDTANNTGNSDNEMTDREKFLKAKEEIKTTAGRYLGDGKFAQIWQRNNGFGWRNIAKKNAALILADYGLTVEEYLAAQKQWIAEGIARSALGAAAEDFANAIIAPAKVLALPAPIETVTGRLKAAIERGDREFTFPTVEELTKPEVDKSATAKFEAGKTYFEFWYEDTGLKHKQVYTVEKRTDKTITVGGKRYKIFLSDYGDGEYARVSYTKRVYAKNIYTELEVDKSATADSLTRAMTIALEHYQDYCRVGNLTAATNELSLYNICRKAVTDLWKEEAA